MTEVAHVRFFTHSAAAALDARSTFRQTWRLSHTADTPALAKLLFIVIGLFVAYWVLKSYKKKVDRRTDKAPGAPEDMVRCAQCGLHLPKSESLTSGNAFYCSVEHRRLHDQAG